MENTARLVERSWGAWRMVGGEEDEHRGYIRLKISNPTSVGAIYTIGNPIWPPDPLYSRKFTIQAQYIQTILFGDLTLFTRSHKISNSTSLGAI